MSSLIVSLIENKKIHKVLLPEKKIGNYWVSDKTENEETKLVNIEGKDGNWTITSNNNVRIIDLNKAELNDKGIRVTKEIVKEVILTEKSMHGIYIVNENKLYILSCSPTYENNLTHYLIKNTQEITIGRGEKNHIVYDSKLVSELHAKIILKDDRVMIENYDTYFGTFVNNNPVGKKTVILFNGDVVTIMGLKIIIMGKSIFINNIANIKRLENHNLFLIKEEINSPVLEESNIDEMVEQYSDNEYYSRAPRIINIIETEKIKIDAPPQIQEKQETPMILILGSTFSMGAMMLISMITTIRTSGELIDTVLSLVATFIMLIGMMLFPILNLKYEKKQKIKYEEKRQARYKEYLNKKASEINKIKNKQRNILYKNYLSADECTKVILKKDPRLWERKIEDYDFLSIRLGQGDTPLKIDIQYPEEEFSMEDDNLVEILNGIGKNSKTLSSAPIVTSLAEKNITAFIKEDEDNFEKFMQNIMIQLVTFQSYEDLKLVFLLDEDKKQKWEYVKMLPHIWDSSHQIRFFADEYNDMNEISQYLEEELNDRLQNEDCNYKAFMPYYLIITDNFKKIQNLNFIKKLLKLKVNPGFSLLCISDDLTQLPNECKVFVDIEKNCGRIFENEISSNNQRKIALEVSNTFFFERIWQKIANIPIRVSLFGKASLPNNYTFLEMFDVGKIEQLNILDRWKMNDSTLSLKAPIGIDENRMPIVLDIHEKFHGPHGLIAGSTGSGKSEFIITYILSLAINYHPDDVAFVLIDYKGGGLAGAFQKNGIKLPHLVGTITNIDTNGLQRSIASIHSEVMRRQVMFNEARNITDEGTIDIYKYQKLYHDGIVKEPIPHLLIICDEFAELKQQQEGFMNELISISRIGRSLGVHLILATQKPAGIVDEQIRSNSKFAVCLKVQDAEDSIDVIKKPNAASLKNAGQFYMQVGNDDYFILGQSAWAGASYFPAETTKKKVDNSIQFISNTGTIIKRLDDSQSVILNNEGEQLTNIVKYIYNLAEKEEIYTKDLWLENVSDTIFVDNIAKKYKIIPRKNRISALIGEYDNPYNQKQGPVKINLQKEENTVIYGNAESGKETLLSTMIYNLMTSYKPDQVQMYLMDFGSETLKIFGESPSVGDVIVMSDEEKIGRFFNMIQEEIFERKQILAEYNGDYKLFIEKSDKSMPMLVVVINNFESFNEMFENEYGDLLLILSREGLKCGIRFVITASSFNDLRYRLSQNFKNKIALQLNKEDDLYNIFESIGKKRVPHIFGRGLCLIDDNIYEFQTAKICNGEDYNIYLKEKIQSLQGSSGISAKPVPVLPDKVNIEDVKAEINSLQSVPIGITDKDLKIYTYNYRKNFINIITSKTSENVMDFCFSLLEVIKQLKDTEVIVINAEKNIKENNFIDVYNELIKGSKTNSKNKFKLCVILGLDRFINSIDEYQFKDQLEKIEETGNCNFIIADNANKMKSHEYDEWYKQYVIGDTGIWIGPGFDSQYLINITENRSRIDDGCGRDFGYVVRDGNYKKIKLLGMKKAGDENE